MNNYESIYPTTISRDHLEDSCFIGLTSTSDESGFISYQAKQDQPISPPCILQARAFPAGWLAGTFGVSSLFAVRSAGSCSLKGLFIFLVSESIPRYVLTFSGELSLLLSSCHNKFYIPPLPS